MSDDAILKYAGFLGHEFVAVCTDGRDGRRRVSCECNSLESAERLSSGEKEVIIYQRTGKSWRRVKGG